MTHIFHMTTASQASDARLSGSYVPLEYAKDGFIHCSYIHQLAGVANRIFKGKRDLVVLKIEKSALKSPVIDENLEGGTEQFPHIYGPLEWSAVADVIDFPADQNGVFQTPAIP